MYSKIGKNNVKSAIEKVINKTATFAEKGKDRKSFWPAKYFFKFNLFNIHLPSSFKYNMACENNRNGIKLANMTTNGRKKHKKITREI